MVRDTHDISMEGEEEVAGRKAHHLVATPKENDTTLFGKQDMWIDNENWFVLKMISNSGDHQTEAVYKHIDFGVNIAAEKFELDLPKDVDTKELDDIS